MLCEDTSIELIVVTNRQEEDDEVCTCCTPDQSCPACRAAAAQICGGEIPFCYE